MRSAALEEYSLPSYSHAPVKEGIVARLESEKLIRGPEASPTQSATMQTSSKNNNRVRLRRLGRPILRKPWKFDIENLFNLRLLLLIKCADPGLLHYAVGPE